MSVKQPGAFQQQDAQLLTSLAPGVEPHAQRRWGRRAPDEFADWPVQMAWLRGEPTRMNSPGEYARYHEPSGMVVIARWGFITTAVSVEDRDEEPPEAVREFKEGMLDDE